MKLRCKVEDWKPAELEDNGLGKFRKTFKECNTILEAKLTEAQAILKRHDKEGLGFSFEQFEIDHFYYLLHVILNLMYISAISYQQATLYYI
ncbi:hypothetical protein CLV57_0626 [Mucilaginibacter auburnensis]|uniref:Uncharacterized protein n=1 Tax=Mucilaginibacter auburnensis TaxID=1457233 RepID=A0A2H9VS49_9SPHI|nr:hypothetical protein CLV57_0626 [Mucilaginibacter auburnensis]